MYTHKVQYYETDKMGITHHSNYVRWMEEARVDYLDKIGYSFDRLEKEGILSPVVAINCNYKKSTTFADEISIEASVKAFNGVKLIISYVMKNDKDEIVFEAESSHTFIDANGSLLRLKNKSPEFYEVLIQQIQK